MNAQLERYTPSLNVGTALASGSWRPDLNIICRLVPEGARVLDLGCGDGLLLTRLMAEKRVLGRGVELSEHGLRQCITKGLSVRQGNLDEGLADYPDGSFDVVILSLTLPYLDQPRWVLHEMGRVGNVAIVSFANMAYWRNRVAVLLGRESIECDLKDGPRARPISLASFRRLCSELGLHVVQEAHTCAVLPDLLSDTGIFVVAR
jgi:methionine biosynthesis protein MetW